MNKHNPDMNASQRPRVLVVDDDDVILLTAAGIIQALDAQTILCKSAEEALEHFADPAERIDILITDIVMPGMSGKKLITSVLNDPEHMDTPIIVLSAKTSVNEVADLLDLGDITFLGKPIRMLPLKFAVKNALTNRRLSLLRQQSMM